MRKWQELEIDYAKKLRECPSKDRPALYVEAYSRVAAARRSDMVSKAPENRTAGVSLVTVHTVAHLCRLHYCVLEIGCARGYACLKLAPFVQEIVGIDVSRPALQEATKLCLDHGIGNVRIESQSPYGIVNQFGVGAFDLAFSVDVYEHLHPEDGFEHLQQVLQILKPGGSYVVFTPNKLSGPHDCTKEVFPNATEPKGFHLNETTYRDLIGNMKRAGFVKPKSVLPLNSVLSRFRDIWYPASWNRLNEWVFCHGVKCRPFRNLMRVVVSAKKPIG